MGAVHGVHGVNGAMWTRRWLIFDLPVSRSSRVHPPGPWVNACTARHDTALHGIAWHVGRADQAPQVEPLRFGSRRERNKSVPIAWLHTDWGANGITLGTWRGYFYMPRIEFWGRGRRYDEEGGIAR